MLKGSSTVLMGWEIPDDFTFETFRVWNFGTFIDAKLNKSGWLCQYN
jgi:hypothetical protein